MFLFTERDTVYCIVRYQKYTLKLLWHCPFNIYSAWDMSQVNNRVLFPANVHVYIPELSSKLQPDREAKL